MQGHVDIINEDRDKDGGDWEIGVAVVVLLIGTFVYIYVNANVSLPPLRAWNIWGLGSLVGSLLTVRPLCIAAWGAWFRSLLL